MPLSAGDRLGPYEILSAIGKGGMGEVYKAHDSRLNRDVAIKVSTGEFSERFELEARAVAALNHPNICTLHDVGPNYLVMELVEGTPLKGPLSAEKAVEYAGQILDALDAAHRKGITHRDLKPDNIMVTKQGIKLLDFGLAKQSSGPLKETDATLVAGLTGEGQIVGTLQYMAPELLQGGTADARCDIFAFGCVLYEMLSGKRAFEGASAASLIAAIMDREPAPLVIAPPLDRIVRKCLAKDPDDRLQTARDLKYNLALAMERQPAYTRKSKRWQWATATAILVIGAFGAGWALSRFRQIPTAQQAVRFQLNPPEGGQFSATQGLAISPDGRTLAFIAIAPGKAGLWVRPLDGTAARLLPGTEGVFSIFWSPDSQTIAYSTVAKLWRVDIAGGAPTAICDLPASGGGAWTTEGVIVFKPQTQNYLFRVPASGGTPAALTTLDTSRGEITHDPPQLLPGGRILFHITASKPEDSGNYVISLANPRERVRVGFATTSATYGDGHLFWIRGSTLVAQRFDADRLQLSGEPEPIVDPVGGGYKVSGGVLLYYGQTAGLSRFTWADRTGKPQSQFGPIAMHGVVRISPDGRHVVASRLSADYDLWMANVERDSWSRFTYIEGGVGFPVWSPDSRYLIFNAGSGPPNIFRKDASGAGAEERVTSSPNSQRPTDWSRDGRWILYHELAPDTNRDLWVLPVTPDGKFETGKSRPYLRTRFSEYGGRFSPELNPRWVAYQSDESGRDEIYVQAFPEPRGKWQISTGGGRYPEWSPDGRELYFLSVDAKLMAAGVKLGANAVEPSMPRELFPLPVNQSTFPYAVAPGGNRFLVRTAVDQGSQRLEVIVNWQTLLRKARESK